MTSSSASSIQKSFKYDVFLSFRGEDTRKTFVDHLYHALDNKGIITYKDDERIEKGERISDQLLRSIEDSRFYIIVFSKNYASSSWCLNELVKIMECQRTTEQTAFPVFYHVEPTEIRNQSGAVGDAFAEHIEKADAGRWRHALKEAADLAGWDFKNAPDGREAKFIQGIVTDISLKLYFINLSVNKKLVGMETRVKKVISSLEIDSNDVRMIGIKGMGGGGKTTLARAVFEHISIWFEGKSFVENVREVSKGSGLKELQKQVLQDVLNDQSIVVKGVYDGKNKMTKMMPGRKVLVVLDDVDDIDQLEALAGEATWFKPGSRILITTRDKQVLIEHDIHDEDIHDVNLLSYEEAICLFSRYAFKTEVPIQGYEVLSENVVLYAAGLPLTIKVLGSFLRGKTENEWIDALERLKTIPLEKTLKVLEISYDGLEKDHKEIFLDVACMLNGEPKDKAITILKSCRLHAQIGLKVLEQKSLINISDGWYLDMHDRIEEMGRDIVRRLHPHEPERHNRLWIKEEIENILVYKLGTEATLSMKLIYTNLHPAIIMEGLSKMKKLRFLYVKNSYMNGYWDIDEVNKWEINEADEYLPNSLQSLHWQCYPFLCLPKTFKANKLVNLEMESSNISQLWEGGERKVLNNLRFLDLSYSKLRTFDLGLTTLLERLVLRECVDFVELHMPAECHKLKSLVLPGSKLSNLYMGLTPQLETLDLGNCDDLVELHMPVECPNLKTLFLTGSKLSSLYMGLTPQLETLDLGRCNDLIELHMPVECPKLKSLVLSGSKLRTLDLGLTTLLETLDLRGCVDFVKLHMPVECPKLISLVLSGSKLRTFDLGLTTLLERLDLGGCVDFVELHMPDECPKLKSLVLSGSKLSNLYMGLTPQLEALDLGRCNDLVELHMPMECPKLKSLVLIGSKLSNLDLGLTPHLEELDLKECYRLQEIYAPTGCLKKLVYLNLSGCSRFKHFLVDKRRQTTGLDSVATLELTTETLDKCPLHPNSSLPKLQFKCRYDEPLPSSSGNLEKLVSFGLCACTNLESFSASIYGLQHLRELTLEGSILEVLKDLWQLESLEKLSLWMKEIMHLPDSIYMLKRLKGLKLNSCWSLEQLPENICRLECLEELHLTDCISFRDIPNSICKMKCLRVLTLECSIPEAPKDLYQLENLEKLSLWMKEIKHLPDSICMLKHLKSLDLESCWLLEQLPMDLGRLEGLEELDLTDCLSLRDIPNSICNMKCLKSLNLSFCILVEKFPEELGNLEWLKELKIEDAGITQLPQSICMLKHLKYLNLKSCWLLKQLPEDICRLECLEGLDLTNCISLRDIPNNICKMKCLNSLSLSYCILVEKLPEEFGRLECLKWLDIQGAGVRYLPQSIFKLRDLCICGSRWLLESYGFTSLFEISTHTASCYVTGINGP